MKTTIAVLFGSMLIWVTSCEVYVVDEPIRDDRNKFIGSYRIEEYSDTYSQITEYSISISKSRYNNNVIYIDNFYAVGIRIRAEVSGDRVIIPYQIINDYEIEGEGWYSYHEIEFDYIVTDLQRFRLRTDYCSAVAW